MAANNADVADFLIVYIEEAHPADGWAYPDNFDIAEHRTIKDRLTAATKLQFLARLAANMTIVADTLADEHNLNRAYGGLFERLYIIHNGTVAYQGLRGPVGFRPGEVASWLTKYRNSMAM